MTSAFLDAPRLVSRVSMLFLPAALLATLETGPGKDADCGGHYAR